MNLIRDIRNEVYNEDTILPELRRLVTSGEVDQLREAINVSEREMDIVVDRMYLLETAPRTISQEMFEAIFQNVEIDQDYIQLFIEEFPFDLKRILPYVINSGVPVSDVIEAYFRRENLEEEYWQEDCGHSCEECEDSSEECEHSREECLSCLEETDSYEFLSWIIDKYRPQNFGVIVNDFEAVIIRHIYSQERD